MKCRWFLLFAALLLATAPSAHALVFFDDFSAGSSQWGNERGNWSAAGGVYNAGSPDNVPPTYSSAQTGLLTDFVMDVDVNNVRDGGLWLRSSYNSGVSGVLLVTGGFGGTFNGFYWHILSNDSYSAGINYASYSGLLGSNAHIKVVVSGNDYKAYVNGSDTPVTTLTTSMFSSGYAGLYDFSVQTFDNVRIDDGQSVVPEPMTVALLSAGMLGMGIVRRKK
ncbi:MAG: PEP-CTERM sorting domain-containing protein [Candidatus Omnitrophota bacterium]